MSFDFGATSGRQRAPQVERRFVGGERIGSSSRRRSDRDGGYTDRRGRNNNDDPINVDNDGDDDGSDESRFSGAEKHAREERRGVGRQRKHSKKSRTKGSRLGRDVVIDKDFAFLSGTESSPDDKGYGEFRHGRNGANDGCSLARLPATLLDDVNSVKTPPLNPGKRGQKERQKHSKSRQGGGNFATKSANYLDQAEEMQHSRDSGTPSSTVSERERGRGNSFGQGGAPSMHKRRGDGSGRKLSAKKPRPGIGALGMVSQSLSKWRFNGGSTTSARRRGTEDADRNEQSLFSNVGQRRVRQLSDRTLSGESDQAVNEPQEVLMISSDDESVENRQTKPPPQNGVALRRGESSAKDQRSGRSTGAEGSHSAAAADDDDDEMDSNRGGRQNWSQHHHRQNDESPSDNVEVSSAEQCRSHRQKENRSPASRQQHNRSPLGAIEHTGGESSHSFSQDSGTYTTPDDPVPMETPHVLVLQDDDSHAFGRSARAAKRDKGAHALKSGTETSRLAFSKYSGHGFGKGTGAKINPGESLRKRAADADEIESCSSFSMDDRLKKYDDRGPNIALWGATESLGKGSCPRDKRTEEPNVDVVSSEYSKKARKKRSTHDREVDNERGSRARSPGIDPNSFYAKSSGNIGRRPAAATNRKKPSQDGPRRKSSRQRSKEVVEIGDSSSSSSESASEDDQDQMDIDKIDGMTDVEKIELATRNSLKESASPQKKRKVFGDRPKVDVVRIAIGKKVFSSGCEFSFQPGSAKDQFLQFAFNTRSDGQSETSTVERQEHTINIYDNSIEEIKYSLFEEEGEGEDESSDQAIDNAAVSSHDGHGDRLSTPDNGTAVPQSSRPCSPLSSSDGEPLSFIAMRIKPNQQNGLERYSSAYLQKCDGSCDDALERKYIVLEIRSIEDFKKMLHQMRQNDTLKLFVGESSKLNPTETEQYTMALVEDSKKDKTRRLISLASPHRRPRTRRSGSVVTSSTSSENEVLLVYPFAADPRAMESAAAGLKEASGADLSEDGTIETTEGRATREEPVGPKSGGGGRTHYLTIRSEDRDRLEPGEFLNDTLIDFWMRWIWRNEDPSESSVHFFTSHFFTTLNEEGPASVSTWTSKKKIDVFGKTFVFLPINESLHWSLCVIVNPGKILNAVKRDEAQSSAPDPNDLLPYILFFDSLKAHRKFKVASTVRKWLNFEWKRLKKSSDVASPFSNNRMGVCDPRIPYQDNSWDCGVFVCRYAYSLYLLRNQPITYNDIRKKGKFFQKAITNRQEFQFNMNDIAGLRSEMGQLVDRLSDLYLDMKEKEKEEKQARKKATTKKADEDRTANRNWTESEEPSSVIV